METPLNVHEPSDVGEARRAAQAVAGHMLATEEARGRAALVATELATNLVKYAGGGEIVARPYCEGAERGVEILALDSGPGITNLQASLADGHSTGGSLGFGLGTVLRGSTLFDIYTGAGLGTAVLARVGQTPAGEPAQPRRRLLDAGYATAKQQQPQSGDAWSARSSGRVEWYTVIDGLGYGPHAAAAAAKAVRVFQEATDSESPAALIERAHLALKLTRGAVMAVAAIDCSAGTLTYASVGNIMGTLLVAGGERQRRLAALDGTVGYNLRKARETVYPWGPGSTLVLNSDGVSTRWNLDRHSGLVTHHPALVAGVLHRDFRRPNDDATVLVVQEP